MPGGGAGNKIPVTPKNKLPPHVQESMSKYENVNWGGNYPGQTQGTKGGGKWGNSSGQLPKTDANNNPITYKEYDVNNKVQGKTRDAERFVRGSDGSLYYTNDHYDSFTKIE